MNEPRADAPLSGPTDDRLRRHRRSRGPGVTEWIGMLFLGAQMALVVHLHRASAPLVFTSPLEGLTEYHFHVTIGTHPLTPAEVRERYHIAPRDRVGLTPAGLQALIRARETRAGETEPVSVRLHSRVNDEPEEIWLWPES